MSNDNNALVSVDLTQLPSTQLGDDSMFDDVTKGGDFLGRLQLYSKGAAVSKGQISGGHWGIPESAEQITDLGVSIDMLPLARRAKALDMSDKEAIITNYDPTSEEFQRIMAASGEKDSGCMYGVSFLIYERSSGRFLEYFCGTKSTRVEAKKIFPYLALSQQDIEARGLTGQEPHGPMPCTLNNRFIEKRYSYHVPVVARCSTPFTQLPAREKIVAQIEAFINPKDEGVEKVDESGNSGRAR
jgi:hypothetical protein